MKSWIANTKINAMLEAGSQKFDGVKVRQALIEYCSRYQEFYPFDILEEPLEFLKSNPNSVGQYGEMRALLSVAAEEYCFSLNEIADALLELIDTPVVTADQARKVINHVFEAFACNESPEDFIPREDDHLCKHLVAIASR